MQIVNGSVPFSSSSGSGPRTETANINLPATATQVTAVLTGFTAQYSSNDGDHHLGRLDIKVVVPQGGVQGTNVRVEATYGLRDWSGNWDDKYEGQIFFAVVTD